MVCEWSAAQTPAPIAGGSRAMNRQQRRQQAAIQRHRAPPYADEGTMMVGTRSCFDNGVKVDIARAVRSVQFVGVDGGTCMWRNGLGYLALRLLGFEPKVCVGGMLYRARNNELRDTVSFCGPGNAGQMFHSSFVGHIWLQLDDEIIDFTGGDWPSLDAGVHQLDNMGPIQWRVRPPTFVWASRKLFDWKPVGRPKLGELWYGRWSGEPVPSLFDNLVDQVVPLAPSIITNLRSAKLPERVVDVLHAIG
jgi:hypothetical protein